jgi:hypothetical protein
MDSLITDYAQFRRTDGTTLEIRDLSLHEQSVWEGVQIMGINPDEDTSTRGIIREAMGANPAKTWFANRKQELVKEGFTLVERDLTEIGIA